MILQPGIGLGPFTFGLSLAQVQLLEGIPDKNIQDSNDPDHWIVEYHALQCRLIFYQEEGGKLGYLHTSHPSCQYQGKNIIGQPIDKVLQEIFAPLTKNWEIDEYDYWKCYTTYPAWITLNVEYGRVTSVELGTPFDEEENYLWPS